MRWELPDDRAYLSVVLITGISILMRLYNLGFRMAHWDEGRVGYRILEYLQTGVYQYRPIVHGPFLFQVNRRVFSLMGASDFTARWIVAIIGGLLPAAAWLYRDRLTDAEVVGLAIFFAFNPILVYYSRFMRNDMLVATFMVFALGWFIRAYDHKNTWSLYFGTAAFALGFTTKENAVMYAGIWIGALILLFDHRLFFARLSEQRWTDKASAIISNIISGLIDTWKPIVLAIIEFVIIITVFYAPRPEFWQAFSSPSMFPGLVSKALFGSAQELYSTWIVGGHQAHPYLSFFEDYIKTLRAGALPLVILAIGGFILDRYSGDSPNDLVAFASYWGFASLLLYPLASDIPAPWNTIHTIVPLAIPAAVALAFIFKQAKDAMAEDDQISVGLIAVIFLAIFAQMGYTTVNRAYLHPQTPSPIVQYGQPADNMKPVLEDVQQISQANDGVDVLYFGSHFEKSWFNKLPLPWYLEQYNAKTNTVGLSSQLSEPLPPIIFAVGDKSDVSGSTASDIRSKLENYREIGSYALVLPLPANKVYVTVFIRQSYLNQQSSLQHFQQEEISEPPVVATHP